MNKGSGRYRGTSYYAIGFFYFDWIMSCISV